MPSRLYDESDVAGEEDNEEAIETLHQKLSEIEKDPGTQLSSVQALSLLLRIQAFITKVGEFRNFFTSYPDSLSNKVRRCTQVKCYLKICCKNVNCTPLELIPFCRTRWGSWHGVLGWVLEL